MLEFDELESLAGSYWKRATIASTRTSFVRPFEFMEDEDWLPARSRFNTKAVGALTTAFSIDDRRRWNPQGYDYFHQLNGTSSRLQVPSDPFYVKPWPKRELMPWERPVGSPLFRRPKQFEQPQDVPFQISFSDAWHTIECLKRRMRREVMFALGLRGKGSRSRRHKRDAASDIRC